MIFDPNRTLEPPLAAAERRIYQERLNALSRPLAEGNLWTDATWRRLQADSVPALDSAGNPVLQIKLTEETVDLGLTRSSILRTSAPPEIAESVLRLRLREELRNGGSPKASERDVAADWELLQQLRLTDRGESDAADLSLTAMQSNIR